jgi:SAM-dependent methyltransferase
MDSGLGAANWSKVLKMSETIDRQRIVAPRLATDDTFRGKFVEVPQIISSWADSFGSLQGKRILDFGCGEGTIALGVACNYGPKLVVGSDINREHRACRSNAASYAGLKELPANLQFEEIHRGEISRHEAFDFIYSWSTFEHIDQALMAEIIAGLRDKLSDPGHLLVQIAPLYYSPEGSHLWALDFRKWEHLTQQLDHIYSNLYTRLERSLAEALWSMFITLNKITAPKLVDEIVKYGFELVREYRSDATIEPPHDLLFAHNREALMTEQIVALFKKR